MEIAIPFIAFASMYVVNQNNNNINETPTETGRSDNANLTNSNQNASKEPVKEKFSNMGRLQKLTNTDIPPSNYPVLNEAQLNDTTHQYVNSNAATDKYFDQNYYQKKINQGRKAGNNMQQIYSLTGDYIAPTDFEHNNMTPFSGGKVRGQIYNMNNAENMLDNMVGNGSQTIEKVEQAPLFKPQENMQYAHGAPNQSDFYQSRVNPGTKASNVKPFQSQNVGPGLNQGYSTEGTGGYNSGMEARNDWLPKTVDQLRVATNPKVEYNLNNLEGPANSYIKNPGQIGKVEKYQPDTFFIQTQDRWLTTTGEEKAPALRPQQEINDTARTTTTQSYAGHATGQNSATYAPRLYEETRREQLPQTNVNHSTAVGKGPHNDLDNAQNSHTNDGGNRGMNKQPDSIRSGFSGAIGAVIAPIMDILNPTRREEFSDNVRTYGNHATTNVKQTYVMNPNDKAPTTIKETTLHTPNLIVSNQGEGTGYMVNKHQPINNQRDTTNSSSFGGVGGGAAQWGEMNYQAGYAQVNNESKEKSVVGRTNHGNAQMFNNQMNVNIARNDNDRNNTRQWVPTNMPHRSISQHTHGSMREPQHYNQSIAVDRISPDLLTAFKENPYTHSLTNTA